ncbi:hypothetical protein FF38_08796 [Lucilia cuprina]|uniref:Nucleolar 27S pre-rRNA processing Urb2/Npa2 C-terminal domain-containing protein n=1 Tax=Lucilia cuprina TaxID=7375 RepID=A0A0L0BS82_LUCCU|nr:hypothetical protein FF38_08796 [Lucilia cuprina]
MSQEEEFSKWLRRKEKSFRENLKFAIKSWQSVEFTLITKYELILKWLSEQDHLTKEQILEEDFTELLKLRAQPGLVGQQVKKDFVQWFLEQAQGSVGEETRKWCNLLQLLVEFELLQDLFRMDYELQCRVYGEIFQSYEKYLLALQQNEGQFLSTFETEFFALVVKGLKETIKRCGDSVSYEKVYTKFTLQPFAQVLLILRSFKVDFFDELLDIESMLCEEIAERHLINRIFNLNLPVRLLCLECAIVKRRGVETFYKYLLLYVFSHFLQQTDCAMMDPSLSLMTAAYLLEMLGRHDVSLNIQVTETEAAVKYLGVQILSAVKARKETHFKEVLMLLCAALRLNPLILEQNVFEITAWMILSPKSGDKEEQELFEEYLVLLMDMFRRLSRAEKFVSNLLKALKENLKNTDLSSNKKRKAKMELETLQKKKKKLADNTNTEEHVEDFSKYLSILFQDFFKPSITKTFNYNNKLSANASFTKLQNYWPSNPVGLSFSKIITGLVSKPSLTIWKSLLYALKDLIESLKTKEQISENSLFLLDFQAALLAQYFAGCKLAEQSDKFLSELQQQREFTNEILKLFGQFLLEKEHQPRIMSAFLELSYFACNFELLLTYYRPDGCQHDSLQPLPAVENLHSFLTAEEWILIQQRVLNFGKSSCKHLLHRLKMQKSQAELLLLSTNKENLPLKSTDNEILNSLLKTPQAKWYLQQLPRSEKVNIAQYFTGKPDLLHLIIDDLELLEFVTLNVYENICKSLNSKHSLLKSLSGSFDKVRECVEVTACELLIKELIDLIINRADQEYKVKKLSVEEIKTSLDLIERLPLGQLRRQRKTIIFALHLSLYRDLKAAQEEDLALKALEILKDLLHFGQQVLIFKYLPTSLLLKLLPAESCWELYEFLFSTVKNEEKGTEQFLQGLTEILSECQKSGSLNEEQRKLLLAAIETLASLNGASAKHMRKYLEGFLKIFSNYLQQNFSAASDGTSKKDKKFVQKTLAGFAPYATTILGKAVKAKETNKAAEEVKETEEFKLEVDEDFRRISKIYIGHSMDYRNPHALRLMQVALNHRELLHLDQDEIEFVLTHYWSQINEDLKNVAEASQKLGTKTIESAVKMIIGNKTNEDLLLILKTIANNVQEANFSNILRLLSLIAKCPFSTIKGAIFNEQYKQITFNITLRLGRDEQQQFNDYDLVINLLNCHQAVLDNKMIPISTDTMDSILSFLMDINIKKFRLSDTNLKVFHNLHLAMTEVCASLIKHRHILLMDRVPQYMHIFKDLLQSIVWYKSERQKDTALPPNEIDDLSELALKVEALMHLIAQHKVGVKRVAPFVLTFIINLMVANKRPTTLYNKIKTHIENICYELVGICDHRVGRFILRCSNEAGRQLYELLVKDYQKYHKFKGKV